MRLPQILASGAALLAAALLGVQFLSMGDDSADPDAATGIQVSRGFRLPAPPRPAKSAAGAHADEWVEKILARPLFSRDRRPSNAPATAASGEVAATLPRLAGIAISPRGRAAIFAGSAGKPVVVAEGATVAGFTVASISPGQVTLQGPDGEKVVAVAFDTTRRTELDQQGVPGIAPNGQPGGPPNFSPNLAPGVPPPGGVPQVPGFGRPRGGVFLQPGQGVPGQGQGGVANAAQRNGISD